jgi:hypothetical protein
MSNAIEVYFIGWQVMPAGWGLESFPLFNVVLDTGAQLTFGLGSLLAKGLPVPEYPTLTEWKKTNGNKAA